MLGLPLPPLLYFHSFILSSFVFIMLGNALLPNCFLFTTLMVSPCLWTMDVRMSSCWQLCYDLERGGRMSLGQTLFEFLLPRMQGQHMLPSSDVLSGNLGHSAGGRAFLTLSQMLIILLRVWIQAKLPDWVNWWQACPGSVFHPQSSEMVTVSGCQLVKFCTSQPGFNSWPSPDSEVYPTEGWRSLLLIRIWR